MISGVPRIVFCLLLMLVSVSCQTADEPEFDLVIRNGSIYDGGGGQPYHGSVAVKGDRLVYMGEIPVDSRGKVEVDAGGKAVAPGFINVMSWATESLLVDGRSQSDIRQGVTLEVMGESLSMGPLSEEMKRLMKEGQGDIQYDITWTTLGQYLEHLVARGVSCNVASFVGSGTVRIHAVGYEDRPPTPDEMDEMKDLVRTAMEEGAMGLGSALIYVPDSYNSTGELTELCRVVAEYDGMYISHLRSEGNQFLEALEEFISIAREAGVAAEVYHLKAAGRQNWPKMAEAIQRIEAVRAEGLAVSADMYTYPAGATGLDAAMPPWVQEGGYDRWRERLREPEIRSRVMREMAQDTDEWENLYFAAGPDKTILVDFKNRDLRKYIGLSLSEVAAERGTSPEETALDLVVEDGSRVGVVYFLMSEENIRLQIARPWVSFGSDAASMAPEGVFLNGNPHPRAYGNVARLLGKYVREEKVISLPEAIRRLTSLPADNLKIRERGRLKPEYFADIVIFDPAAVQDHATFDNPHQYSTGVLHVWVNGSQVLKDGEHTGALPGVVVRGPGYKGSTDSMNP